MEKFINSTQKFLPFVAGLSTVPKIVVSIIVICLAVLFLILIWIPPNGNIESKQIRPKKSSPERKKYTEEANESNNSKHHKLIASEPEILFSDGAKEQKSIINKINTLNNVQSDKEKTNLESKIILMFSNALALSSTYDSDAEIEKTIDYSLRKDRPDLAAKYVVNISSDYDRDKDIKKIIDYCINSEKFDIAQQLVEKISSSYDRDKYRLKIINKVRADR